MNGGLKNPHKIPPGFIPILIILLRFIPFVTNYGFSQLVEQFDAGSITFQGVKKHPTQISGVKLNPLTTLTALWGHF